MCVNIMICSDSCLRKVGRALIARGRERYQCSERRHGLICAMADRDSRC